ncbi:unnamed protein product, partial [Rotaria magnacalcarata]
MPTTIHPRQTNNIIPKLDDMSSFRLTSFYTMFDNNNLI